MVAHKTSQNRIATIDGQHKILTTGILGSNFGTHVLYALGSNQYGELSMLTTDPFIEEPTRIGNLWTNFHTDGNNMLLINDQGVNRHMGGEPNITLIPSTNRYIYSFLFPYIDSADPLEIKWAGVGIRSNSNYIRIFDLYTGQVYAQLLVGDTDSVAEPLKSFGLKSLPYRTGLRNDEFTYAISNIGQSFILIVQNLYRIHYTNDQFQLTQVTSVIVDDQEPISIENKCSVISDGFLVITDSNPSCSRIFRLNSVVNNEYDKIHSLEEILPATYFDDYIDKTTLNITGFYANDDQIIFDASVLFNQSILVRNDVRQGAGISTSVITLPSGVVHSMRFIFSGDMDKLYLLLASDVGGGALFGPSFDEMRTFGPNPPGSSLADGYIPYAAIVATGLTNVLGAWNSIYENISDNISLSVENHGLGVFYDYDTENRYVMGFGLNDAGQIGDTFGFIGENAYIWVDPRGFNQNSGPVTDLDSVLAVVTSGTGDIWPIAKRNISLIYSREPL